MKAQQMAAQGTDNTGDLDAWANQIARLEPEVAQRVIEYARRIASTRLPKGDREFAEAQARAVKRALRRKRKDQ